jgi:hypothetical protein
MVYTIHSIPSYSFLISSYSRLSPPLRSSGDGEAAGGAAAARSSPAATSQHGSTEGSVPRGRDVARPDSRAASGVDDAPTAASVVPGAAAVEAEATPAWWREKVDRDLDLARRAEWTMRRPPPLPYRPRRRWRLRRRPRGGGRRSTATWI